MAFDVRWRPFELNPNLPKGKGYDKMQYYESKFGPAMVRSMIPRMKAVAEEYGIHMEYGGSVGNTLDSHVRTSYSPLHVCEYFYTNESIFLLMPHHRG